MIREYQSKDLNACAKLLMEAYNNELWQCRWNMETAAKYLSEYVDYKNFVGYVICENEEIIGAAFTHKKAWWTNDELFVDEIFIKPDMQGSGYGKTLLSFLENYARSQGLAGLTLLTNKYMPSKGFYDKHGYELAEHVVFMYKAFE